MQVLRVSEILQREVGEQIPAARGILKAIYKRSTGTNSQGPWSLQNAIITDGAAELKLKLSGKDELPESWKNKEVYLLAKHGEKGFTGLRFEEDSYTKKDTGEKVTAKILKVTATGSITLNQPATEKAPQTPPPNVPCDADGRPLEDPNIGEPDRPPQQTPPSQPPKGKAPLTPQEKWALDEKAVHDASRCIAQFANLYLLVSEAVRGYVAPAYQARHGVAMTPEQVQTCTTTFYIDAQKRGLSGSLPTTSIEPFLKPKGGQQ